VRRLVHAARYVVGELAALLAIVLSVVIDVWPRLVPDLRHLIARHDFAETHDALASWLDRHFELIESATPWLHPVGRRIADSCGTTWERAPFSLARVPAQVICTRRIWAAYGCDGHLQSRLTELSSTLRAIGWGNLRGGSWDVRGGLGGPSASQMRTLSWGPGGGLAHELPSLAGQSDVLRESANMYVSWADRTDPGDIVAPRSARGADPAHASLLYQPVEVGGEDEGVLAAQALLRHENTIIVGLQADYYRNANVNIEPDRLPKRFRLGRGYLP
jgi:hypothetical protein